MSNFVDKLTFEIQESPVLYDINGNVLTSKNHKVLSRSDNGTELSVIKNSYYPTYNKHFMESTETMKKISGFDITGYSEINNGAIVISHLKNTVKDLKIGDHPIQDYLILGSSCDGKYAFFIGTTTVLLRCTNQFSNISKIEKVRHTKSAPKKIEELLKSLEVYFQNRGTMYKNFEKMIKVKVDEEVKELAINYLLDLDQQEMLDGNVSTQKLNQAEQLYLAMGSEMDAVGQNLWGMFNGVTYYTTHVLKQKEPVFGNLFGATANLNKKAYNFALNQLQLS